MVQWRGARYGACGAVVQCMVQCRLWRVWCGGALYGAAPDVARMMQYVYGARCGACSKAWCVRVRV